MTLGVDLAAHLPGNLDGVDSWNNAIQALDALLQEYGTIPCAILHKCSLAAETMQTGLLSFWPPILLLSNGAASSLLVNVTRVTQTPALGFNVNA